MLGQQQGALRGASGRRPCGSAVPAPARPAPARAGRRTLCARAATQQPGGEGGSGPGGASGADTGPSTSGPQQQQPAGTPQQHRAMWQHHGGWRPGRVGGALGAGLAGSWAVAVPGLGGGSNGGGGGGSGSGGGGGGGWWRGGGGDAGGGGGGGGGNPLFDVAAAASGAAGAAGGGGRSKGERRKKKGEPAAEELDPEAAAEEALLEEAEAPTEGGDGAGSAAAAAGGKLDAHALVTSDTELDEMARDAGVAGDGERHGTRRCVEVVIEGWPEVGALPKQSELKDMLSVQEGFVFDYQDVVDDRRKLELQYDEYISNVDIRTEYVDDKSNHQRVVYKFRPYVFEGIDTIEVKNATLMPQRVVDDIIKSCLPDHPYRVEIGLMDKVRERIEKWYQDRGLPFCYVGYFDGMEEGVLRANVIEAKVNDVAVRYERPGAGDDSEGMAVYSQGEVVPAERIIAAAGFKKGEHYHIDDGQDAINNIYACGLIEEINIEPEQDMQDPSKINIKVVVEEVQPKSMEMDLDWAFALKDGVPQITRQALIPGGSVEVSHENLFGDSQSLSVSLSASDWRNPAADLGFQMSFTEPFYKPNTTRNVQVFNTRKMSPVFTPGAEPDVPPVFVDRFGAKAWTSHVGGQDNKVEHALMLQQIQTVDENGQPVSKGTKVARGYYADNGPPTTLSGTGRDVSLSYQGFAALDNVQFVNGNQLGRRLLLQVDQGLNVKVPLPGGRALGFGGGLYNRMTAAATAFLQLPGLPRLTDDDVWIARRAPNTLVLHARAGNCLGDMASYDYFALGGPYSVRGYAPGELGAARRFAELAAEVRLPLKNCARRLPGTAYAFAEYGSDLGSGRSLAGAPTEYYRKAGRGASWGVGLKALGACRFEYARDCNAGTGAVFVHWGERF